MADDETPIVAAPASTTRYLRLAVTTLLLVYGVVILRARDFAAIDNVNLPIHETGHIVFGFFGDLIAAMGGSIFQVLLPAIFVAYFMRRRDSFAASVALWWVAENLWYVAVYVADAQEQRLPLVGGGEHDWAFILAELDVLRYDDRIAAMIRFAGTAIFAFSILWGYASAAAVRGARASASASSSATS
ncbi:MAG TPA: hypothetical protein VHM30_20325 [Gemmatimonadaceae bacterium]|nr:hypothetical protein [Gemmatimonadaceae bacterium]